MVHLCSQTRLKCHQSYLLQALFLSPLDLVIVLWVAATKLLQRKSGAICVKGEVKEGYMWTYCDNRKSICGEGGSEPGPALLSFRDAILPLWLFRSSFPWPTQTGFYETQENSKTKLVQALICEYGEFLDDLGINFPLEKGSAFQSRWHLRITCESVQEWVCLAPPPEFLIQVDWD